MIFLLSDIVKSKYNDEYDIYYDALRIIIAEMLMNKFSTGISDRFIAVLLSSKDVYVLLYQNDHVYDIDKTIGVILYTTANTNNEYKIYLLLLAINRTYRNYGYGTVFMKEFIEYIKNINNKNKRIILHSLDKSINYYKSLGFTPITDKLTNYRKLFRYEKYDKNHILFDLTFT